MLLLLWELWAPNPRVSVICVPWNACFQFQGSFRMETEPTVNMLILTARRTMAKSDD